MTNTMYYDKNNYYTNSFWFKPDKTCPHCGEIIEKGTDLNKYISITINPSKLEKQRKRWEYNNTIE